MYTLNRPESTMDLPVANPESFADFIMNDRAGDINIDRLIAIFGMHNTRLLRSDTFPSYGLHEGQLRACMDRAQTVVMDTLVGDDMPEDWVVSFSDTDEVLEFMEEVSDQYALVLGTTIKEVTNG